MKLDYDIVYGKFIKRPNRFIVHIETDEGEVIAHCPNTGRMKELLLDGVEVLLSYHPEPHRKTKYELRMIKKDQIWVSIDSQLPNALVEEAIRNCTIEELKGYDTLTRESKFGNSRFDIKLEGENLCYVEVKGVTFEIDGWGYFPDAPTNRGLKHINEMCEVVKNGYRGVIVFLIQHGNIKGFSPNERIDEDFAKALRQAASEGVEILAYGCEVTPKEVLVVKRLPVKL